MQLRQIAHRECRLACFLKNEMRMSSGLINRLKWQQRIFVNGNVEHNDFCVKPGDVVTVELDEPTPDYPAQDGALEIRYEDDFLLAVEKPAGMLIHPSQSKNEGTLANFVLGYYQRTGQQSAFHPITRLDRDTFGIVLLAKNSHVHALMQQTEVAKTYHALVLGGPEADSGVIDAPIARKELPSLLREVRADGKPCITQYRVLQRGNGYSKLALRPVTGRTHQLRVHCAYMGFPILGDPQYGNACSNYGLPYQMLCAKTLDFLHPLTGERQHLESAQEVGLSDSDV